MSEEFYIGQIFENDYPMEAAIWCNEHGLKIVELDNELYQIQEIPEPSIDEKKKEVREVRDGYINDIEWRISRYRDQVEMQIPTTDTEETYHQILQYIQYLRDYPESSETWYEQNPLTFDEWIVK